ncbi:MAG TPA: hypothetical protein VJV78_31810 [Polyangiales bacterium]|nr:hypothetical protein [Polyangiales bacterium]
MQILLAAFKSIARRPLAPVEVKPGWHRFGAMETSSYGNLVSMVLLLLVLEAPAVHLILGAVMEDGALRGVIRILLLSSSVYVALWLIGDLRLLRETPGVMLGDGMLMVALGQRVNGEVALTNVTAAQRLLEPADDTSSIRITPQPRPNCRIRLSSAVSMRGLFGAPLRGEMLDVYVDDPAGLVASIAALHPH